MKCGGRSDGEAKKWQMIFTVHRSDFDDRDCLPVPRRRQQRHEILCVFSPFLPIYLLLGLQILSGIDCATPVPVCGLAPPNLRLEVCGAGRACEGERDGRGHCGPLE